MRGSDASLVKYSVMSTFSPLAQVMGSTRSNLTTLVGPGAGVGDGVDSSVGLGMGDDVGVGVDAGVDGSVGAGVGVETGVGAVSTLGVWVEVGLTTSSSTHPAKVHVTKFNKNITATIFFILIISSIPS